MSKKNKRPTVYEEYFDNIKKAEEKYGPNTIVLIEMGKFYEVYGSCVYPSSYDKVSEVARILNMNPGKKSKPEHMQLRFVGFPNYVYEIHKHKLLQAGYTLIRYDQKGDSESNNGKVVPRYIGTVESPGVYLESTNITNTLLVIYIVEHSTSKTKVLSIGLSSTDLRTGNSTVYEIHSHPSNYHYPLEETYRFVFSAQPVEIRVYAKIETGTQKYITRYLELDQYQAVWQEPSKDCISIDYQSEFLGKLFQISKKQNPIDTLGLSRTQMACTSFTLMLKYIDEYHSSMLHKIHLPDLEETKYLILANNAIRQLRIVPPAGETGMSSLFNVICKTQTIMGRRMLKYRILHPFTSVNDINFRLDLLDECSQIGGGTNEIDQLLNPISDLESTYRLLLLRKINPQDFVERIYESHKAILLLCKTIHREKNGQLRTPKLSTLCPLVSDFKKSMGYLEFFNMERMGKITFPPEESFLNLGINSDIDRLQSELSECDRVFEETVKWLTPLIPTRKNENNPIKIDYNEIDGYHLYATAAKAEHLKRNTEVNSKMKFKPTKNKVKLTNEKLERASTRKHTILEKLRPMIMVVYYKITIEWYTKHELILERMNRFICEIDIANCLAKVSTQYKYIRPIVVENDSGFVHAIQMRNPYIERIIDEEYIPNDINIGRKTKGILLYGPNMAGKSTYMRAVGLNIVMAQIGGHVAAQSFKFSPYTQLITRIMGEDDERRGRSSFMVEISELRIMLKCANPKTLALGDEICRGTGYLDALSLVSSSIQTMHKNGASFIFTTHLHDLKHRDEIMALDNHGIKFMHLSVDSISATELNFGRTLKDGPGPETYGVEIAKSLGMGDEFIEEALRIRNNLEDGSFISTKKSRYNTKKRITECEQCGSRKDLETHHIKEQSSADRHGFINHQHKNHVSNLMVLCSKCHLKITKKRYNESSSL